MKTSTIRVCEQIKQLRQEAEQAKQNKEFELAFALLDQADTLAEQNGVDMEV